MHLGVSLLSPPAGNSMDSIIIGLFLGSTIGLTDSVKTALGFERDTEERGVT